MLGSAVFGKDRTASNRMFAFYIRDFVDEDSDVHLYVDSFRPWDGDLHQN